MPQIQLDKNKMGIKETDLTYNRMIDFFKCFIDHLSIGNLKIKTHKN